MAEKLIRRTYPELEKADLSRKSLVVCLAGTATSVVYVTPEFERHTGYSARDVIGKNLRLLQGPETEAEAVSLFRHLIQTGQSGRVVITNYRKDGTKFRHACDFRPVRSTKSDIVTHFVALQSAV